MSVDYFLKIEGIPGESQDNTHKDEIQPMSWSWSETQRGSFSAGGGGGTGKVEMQDFSFTMSVNKASPKLMLACAQGTHIPSALLTCRKAGKEQQEYIKIKFIDLLVSSFQTGGSGDFPVDSITLNFAKIEYEYYPQKKDGTLDSKVPVWYDLKTMKGG
jgi:type VI secretion system secreted protein Hcp